MHSEHQVTIEKLVVGGQGLARLPYQDKSLVVFVPRTAPEDQVKIRITQAEKNHLSAEVIDILKPAPSRRPPPCPYFHSCGGCSWQHLDERTQLQQKELILSDLLKKFIPETNYELLPSVPSPDSFHYRNRIQLKQLNSELGYFKRGTHEIVDIEHCWIAEDEISNRITEVKAKLRPSKELKKFELRLNHLKEFEFYPIGNDGEGLSFSQVNNGVNEQLVKTTLNLIATQPPTQLTELYAGAGNFTFELLQALPDLQIESVEMNPKLTAFATQKMKDLKLQKRLFAFTSDCESFVRRRPLSNEMVLLDPPRAGCSPVVLEKLITACPQNIVYISCHPVFLARDLQKILKAQPDYRITYLRIFDMFPQTDHFETLVMLSK